MLTIDDAQWADPASVRFLNYLARRLADLPVLLALAIRAGDTGTQDCEVVSVADAMVLEPAPLSVDTGERMLGVALGRCPELEFARACHAATGGNPFLLSELVSWPPTGSSRRRLRHPRSPTSRLGLSRAGCCCV